MIPLNVGLVYLDLPDQAWSRKIWIKEVIAYSRLLYDTGYSTKAGAGRVLTHERKGGHWS